MYSQLFVYLPFVKHLKSSLFLGAGLVVKTCIVFYMSDVKDCAPSDGNFGQPVFINKALLLGWRDYSRVKNICCSCRQDLLLQVHNLTLTWKVIIICKPSARGSSQGPSCPLQAPGMDVVHGHTFRPNTHTYKIRLDRQQTGMQTDRG